MAVPVGEGRTVPENVGSQPLADVPVDPSTLASATVLADGSGPEAVDRALDDWLALTAGALAGMAEEAVRIGVAYAAEREAFGQKIGAFQAVGHRLADVATASAGATAAGPGGGMGGRRRIRAGAPSSPPWPSPSPPARRVTPPTSPSTSTAATGSCSSTTSSSTTGGRGVGQRAHEPGGGGPPGGGQALRAEGGVLMDFRLGESSEARRTEVRAFLDEHMSLDLEERVYRTGVSHDEGVHPGPGGGGLDGAELARRVRRQGLDPEEMVAVGRSSASPTPRCTASGPP